MLYIFILGRGIFPRKGMVINSLVKLLTEYDFDRNVELIPLYYLDEIRKSFIYPCIRDSFIIKIDQQTCYCNDNMAQFARIVENRYKDSYNKQVDICGHYLPRDLVEHIRKHMLITPFLGRLYELTGYNVVVDNYFIHKRFLF